MLQGNARTAGLDVGDKYSVLCILDTATGEVIEESRLRTSKVSFERYFSRTEAMCVALETGTHSPWVNRLLESHHHKVLIANPRKLRLVYGGTQKSDRLDAEKLARLARFDPSLLAPVKHRGLQSQAHLAILRARAALVASRTALTNHVRGAVKSFGARIPTCAAEQFPNKAALHLPEALRPALKGVLEMIAKLSEEIKAFDAQLEVLANKTYPETEALRQVKGVGPVTALTFVLTLEDPRRFSKSREVGPYLGLVPGQRQSGARDIRQGITKAGDGDTRRLLVQCAHYLLGPRGKDCDLRRYGEKLMAKGGLHAKQRAVVAVARKLAVLLHHLWVSGEVYEPFYNQKRTPTPLVTA